MPNINLVALQNSVEDLELETKERVAQWLQEFNRQCFGIDPRARALAITNLEQAFLWLRQSVIIPNKEGRTHHGDQG